MNTHSTQNTYTALVAGGTGLVGGILIEKLAENPLYEKVYVLSRRALSYESKKIQVFVVDYEQMEEGMKECPSATHYFCCLGSHAASKEVLHKVDYIYPLLFAERAKKDPHCKHFSIITSMGASARSNIPYMRVKGQVEKALEHLEMNSLHILRPSLILGERKKKRFWEEIFKGVIKVISFFCIGTHGGCMSIQALDIAQGMIKIVQSDASGVHRYSSIAIKKLSRAYHS